MVAVSLHQIYDRSFGLHSFCASVLWCVGAGHSLCLCTGHRVKDLICGSALLTEALCWNCHADLGEVSLES